MALTISDVAPDAHLTNIAMEYGEGGGFAYEQLMPTRSVSRDYFKYMIWNLRDFLQGSQFDTRRGPGASATEAITPGGSFVTGNVHERSLKALLPDEIINNAANGADYVNGTIRSLMNSLRLEVELEFRDAVLGVSNSTTITTKWDAASGVDIEGDIDAARELFVKLCGFEPNYILIPPAVADVVKRDSSVRDLQKYTNNLVNQGMLPDQMFGLNVVVPGAIQDTANPGASASISRAWSADDCALMYVNMGAANSPTEMTAIQRFVSTSAVGTPWAARSWRDSDVSKQSTWYQAMTFDEIKVVADCIYVLDDCLT